MGSYYLYLISCCQKSAISKYHRKDYQVEAGPGCHLSPHNHKPGDHESHRLSQHDSDTSWRSDQHLSRRAPVDTILQRCHRKASARGKIQPASCRPWIAGWGSQSWGFLDYLVIILEKGCLGNPLIDKRYLLFTKRRIVVTTEGSNNNKKR